MLKDDMLFGIASLVAKNKNGFMHIRGKLRKSRRRIRYVHAWTKYGVLLCAQQNL